MLPFFEWIVERAIIFVGEIVEEHEFESLSADEVIDALLSDDVDFEGHSGRCYNATSNNQPRATRAKRKS